MTQATDYQCPAPSAKFNEDVYQTLFQRMEERFASVGLLGGLYGVLTVLSVLSVYALTQRSGRIQPTAIVLCLTLLALFTSTTIHMITSILSWQSDFATALIWSGRIIWSYDKYINFQIPLQNVIGAYSEQFQGCASTAALTINVIIGDTIVCWRACVVWQNNRVVLAVCGVFLLATFALGAIDTTLSCNVHLHWSRTLFNVPVAGAMYKGFPAGIAACVLSLTTNLLATLLVGCKAWGSRKRLRRYFVGGPVASQVEKLFSLLIESGAIYCALWAVIVAFQLAMELPAPRPSQVKDMFASVVGVFLDAALVPLIAIYPTVIIVFVALRRSHVEKALTHQNQSVPTPHLSLAIDTIAATSRHDGGMSSPGTSGVWAMPVNAQDGDDSEDAPSATRGSEDQHSKSKMEGII